MYNEIAGWHGGRIKAWTQGVEFEHAAETQVHAIASMPFIHSHVAIMPDVHAGIGATVGSVIPTKAAIIPAAVGVDIGCGMAAIRTSLTANDLPDDLGPLRLEIEAAVPHGGPGPSAGWTNKAAPALVSSAWRGIEARFDSITQRYPDFKNGNSFSHLGTLGGGNHFIEVCLDEDQRVWLMVHSGSRGIGNLIGRTFIDKAKELLVKRGVYVPDKDLAWFDEGTPEFRDYVESMLWAQDFARVNRDIMMARTLMVMRKFFPSFQTDKTAVNCHHNFAEKENHFGEELWITRKGAVRARAGDLGIIPGSMGAKSYIVRGLGEAESFCSCSHGAGRRMSRGGAKKAFTVEDHIEATKGVECRKDSGVLDETPGAYKDIDAVMTAQSDLVEIVHTLKQVVCVKG